MESFEGEDCEERGALAGSRFDCIKAYSFARVQAIVSLRVRDYAPQGRRSVLRLAEKGGKQHEVPVHHKLEEYLDAYVEAAGIGVLRTRRSFVRPLARRDS